MKFINKRVKVTKENNKVMIFYNNVLITSYKLGEGKINCRKEHLVEFFVAKWIKGDLFAEYARRKSRKV